MRLASRLSRDDRLGLLVILVGTLLAELVFTAGLLPNPTPPLLALVAVVAFRFSNRLAIIASGVVFSYLATVFLTHHGTEPVDATVRLPVILLSIIALIGVILMLKRQVLAGVIAEARLAERESVNRELARHADQLARANHDLEAFVHLLSHDLRAPLRTISSYLTILVRRFPTDAESARLIHLTVEATENARGMVTGLLDYAVAAGPDGGRIEAVASETALAEATANLAEAISISGTTIRAGSLPEVAYHHQHLVQLFQNLIGNAIKYRSEQPPRLTVQAAREDGGWRFDVGDNGRGIDPSLQSRLFTMHDRLGADPSIAGSGVGLALCKRIVERHGGRIWASSRPGRGSTFSFTIPGNPTSATPTAKDKP